jgi:hypothetical protein
MNKRVVFSFIGAVAARSPVATTYVDNGAYLAHEGISDFGSFLERYFPPALSSA